MQAVNSNPKSPDQDPRQDPPERSRRLAQVRSEQLRRGHEPCFRTDRRLTCRESACQWRAQCCRLVAVWLR